MVQRLKFMNLKTELLHVLGKPPGISYATSHHAALFHPGLECPGVSSQLATKALIASE